MKLSRRDELHMRILAMRQFAYTVSEDALGIAENIVTEAEEEFEEMAKIETSQAASHR